VAPESLKEQKVVITLVRQGCKSIEEYQDYKTETETTYSRQEQPIDIGKSNDNFKDRKPKCFNYNKYGHIAKECWKKKKKRQGNVSNAAEKDTLPKTIKGNSQ